MKNNEKQYYIYLRSTKERIPCTREEFNNYYRDINAFRKTQQRHGKCVCPEAKRLDCDMDCETCFFHKAGDTRSLDCMMTDEEGNEQAWLDGISDPLAVVDANLEEMELMDALRSLLVSLTKDEQAICTAIMDNLSERAAAASLNLSRNTYVYRRDKVLEQLKNSLKKFL